jgi:sialate O-acetylesterase
MLLKSCRLIIASSLATAALPADTAAAPRLDGIIGDHAVVQRDRPIALSGSAGPGETVMIGFAGRSVLAEADGRGRFDTTLPAPAAGGPYDLTIAAPSGATVFHDILVGDVYLCSGQSNMELQVQSAQDLIPDAHAPADDQLRLLTIPKAVAVAPLEHFADPPQWVSAGPATAPTFSAACFYMVQALRRTAKVPIGAVHSSWGGSRISAWMSDAALRTAGMAAEADLLALYARDPAAANRRASAVWEEWWRARSGDAKGAEPWQPGAALAWQAVPRFEEFETWGVPELAAYNGMLWYQRAVDLSRAQAQGPATLSIGRIDDADRTWVNGIGVGGSSDAGQQRVYTIAAGMLKPGRNIITVNDDDVYAYGGMTGPTDVMRLTFADGSSVPLDTGWRYAIAKPGAGSAPRVPWDSINGAGTLFNAMIAPLARTALAGMAWYQGESDTGIPGYDRRLTAMIADWRTRFGKDAAFAIVQLSSYGTPATKPGDSGWADVRDAQRRVAAADPHGGMAVTLDLGDPLDIHPGEKHEVGQRLAQVMRARVYGEPLAPAGPAIANARQTPGGGVTLRFSGVTGGLQAHGSSRGIGFELCDTVSNSCRYADGQIAGDQVTLAGDGQPVARVRYAWADVPAINLSDGAKLPVGTFEIEVH